MSVVAGNTDTVLDFQPDWESLDRFMREIKYDENFNATHNGELMSEINNREFKELMLMN